MDGFKRGDKVVCINDYISDLTINKEYTVKDYRYEGAWLVVLEEYPQNIYYPERFKLISIEDGP